MYRRDCTALVYQAGPGVVINNILNLPYLNEHRRNELYLRITVQSPTGSIEPDTDIEVKLRYKLLRREN